jgi:hypothetical protein
MDEVGVHDPCGGDIVDRLRLIVRLDGIDRVVSGPREHNGAFNPGHGIHVGINLGRVDHTADDAE